GERCPPRYRNAPRPAEAGRKRSRSGSRRRASGTAGDPAPARARSAPGLPKGPREKRPVAGPGRARSAPAAPHRSNRRCYRDDAWLQRLTFLSGRSGRKGRRPCRAEAACALGPLSGCARVSSGGCRRQPLPDGGLLTYFSSISIKATGASLSLMTLWETPTLLL